MKNLSEYKHAKLQRGTHIGFYSITTKFRIRVRDSKYRRWKTFAESCFPEEIYDMWDNENKTD